jgi:vacuolar-type H+-ATPase subunit F/Vma7
MQPIVFIGDALTGAGFRLAGIEAHAPPAAQVPAVFERALGAARVIVLTRWAARALAPATLRKALAGETPLVVVVNDIREPDREPEVPRAIRAVLGIDT